MGFFGGSISGYGGGMYEPIDMMGGINDALQQNAALGASMPKKKGGFGNFLQAFAGHYGDALTGNPVYAQQMAQQAEQEQMEQWYERKRQDELADYEAKKGIDAKYSSPDYDADIREFQQAKQLGYVPENMSYQDFARMKNPGQFVPPAPVNIPYGATVEGGDNSGNVPQVSDETGYNALPPGAMYKDPNGVIRRKGGQSVPPTGGFPPSGY